MLSFLKFSRLRLAIFILMIPAGFVLFLTFLGGSLVSMGMGSHFDLTETLLYYIVFAPLLILYPFVNSHSILDLLFPLVFLVSLILLIVYWWLFAGIIEYPFKRGLELMRKDKKI